MAEAPILAVGQQEWLLTNTNSREVTVRLERSFAEQEILSAAQANAFPPFAALFPEQMLSSHQLTSIRKATIVACQVSAVACRGSEARAQLRMIAEQARRCRSIAADRDGSRLTIAFADLHDALVAIREVRQRCCNATGDTSLAFVLTEGPTHFARDENSLECFGPTPERAAEFLSDVLPSDLVVVGDVADDRFARHSLRQYFGEPIDGRQALTYSLT
jgi:hypothetical protein